MKTVKLAGNAVQEIIPDYALPAEKWYGAAFAAECVEAPDEVQQGWIYDAESGTFAPPGEPLAPEPTEMEVLQQENRRLTAQVNALTESGQMLEDCLIEMAAIVYA